MHTVGENTRAPQVLDFSHAEIGKPLSLQKNLDMASTLNNIPLTLNLDFKAFLLFFEQLPIEHKRLILSALEHKMDEKKQSPEIGRSLKGSVISYIMPFEPVASDSWEALA